MRIVPDRLTPDRPLEAVQDVAVMDLLARQANQLREVTRKLEAHHAVTEALTNAPALLATAPQVLHAIGVTLNWDLGMLWLPSEDSGGLRCQALWRRESHTVCDPAGAVQLPSGFAAARRVFETCEALWVEDIQKSDLAGSGLEAGLHALCAVPLVRSGKPCGAMVLFRRRCDPLDEGVREILIDLGIRIGFYASLKEAEEALRASEKQYRLLFENVLTGIYRAGPDGRILIANPAMIRMLGYRSFKDAAASDFGGLRLGPMHWIADATGENRGVESEWIRAGGAVIVARENVNRVLDEQGNVLYYDGTVEDITERRAAERERALYTQRLEQAQQRLESQSKDLHRARDAAVDASRMKSEFLANMSHEMRTPMSGIIGLTGLVLETELSKEQSEYLGMVKLSADSLLGLLNDILDSAKIEAGKLDFDPTEFSLREMLEPSFKMMALQAAEKRLALNYEVAPDVPERIVADAGRLRQVLVNLVGNAIKFTDQGRVDTSVAVESRTAEEIVLRFSVRDTGIGIPKEKQAGIFEPFAQADRSTSRKYGGTGLGLTICSRLVELMGGQLTLQSEPGQGSVFSFTATTALPGAGAAAGALPAGTGTPSAPPSGLSILVAEDSAVNLKIALRLLEREGHAVTSARNGVEALELLALGSFDLVLMDVEMPGKSGLEASEEIRRREKSTGAHIPIVAMTAHVMDGDERRCLDAGMDGYIGKPIRRDVLAKVIQKAILTRKSA